MDKIAYSRLIIIWHRHKPWHIRSKPLYILKMTAIGAGLGYISLILLGSKTLFFLFMLVLALRLIYRLAKGDWFDLASQLGLKCWHCDTVFIKDFILKDIMEKNSCPKCHHPVYEDSSG